MDKSKIISAPVKIRMMNRSLASFFFSSSDQTGTVDEKHLKELEDRVVSVQRAVDERLRPRLRDMEEQEAAQRQGLTGINQDIDTILGDIDNLNDILKSIPEGCFNSPPIEEA